MITYLQERDLKHVIQCLSWLCRTSRDVALSFTLELVHDQAVASGCRLRSVTQTEDVGKPRWTSCRYPTARVNTTGLSVCSERRATVLATGIRPPGRRATPPRGSDFSCQTCIHVTTCMQVYFIYTCSNVLQQDVPS